MNFSISKFSIELFLGHISPNLCLNAITDSNVIYHKFFRFEFDDNVSVCFSGFFVTNR